MPNIITRAGCSLAKPWPIAASLAKSPRVPLTGYKISIYISSVQAGYITRYSHVMPCEVDLNKYLIRKPLSTFLIRMASDAMIDVGIYEDDILIVDKSLEAKNGSIIVAMLEEKFMARRLIYSDNKKYLVPENPKYEAIEVKPKDEFHIWGVVTKSLHKLP